jgi:hypothetical protein
MFKSVTEFSAANSIDQLAGMPGYEAFKKGDDSIGILVGKISAGNSARAERVAAMISAGLTKLKKTVLTGGYLARPSIEESPEVYVHLGRAECAVLVNTCAPQLAQSGDEEQFNDHVWTMVYMILTEQADTGLPKESRVLLGIGHSDSYHQVYFGKLGEPLAENATDPPHEMIHHLSSGVRPLELKRRMIPYFDTSPSPVP